MNTKLVKWADDAGHEYRLVVRDANVQVGMKRTLLIQTAQAEEQAVEAPGDDLDALSRRILHTLIYPSLIAATVEAQGFDVWPVPFAAFAELPEPLEAQWEQAVYSLNPHWLPAETDEKKG